MIQKVKKVIAYNIVVGIVALQVIALLNYWYFIYNNITNAAINETIVYQGRIVDANSVAIEDGSYSMLFRIYDAETGGNLLWEEHWDGITVQNSTTAPQVSVVDGLFTVDLNGVCQNWTTGGCAVQTGGVDFTTGNLYLQVCLDADGDAETNNDVDCDGPNSAYEEKFSPRKRFSSIAYAMNADKIDGEDIVTEGGNIPLLNYNNIWEGVQTIAIQSASNKGIVIEGAASQSANLFEIKNNSQEVVSAFNAQGILETTNVITPKITTPSTGIGAPPSTEDANIASYWKFDDGTGTTTTDEEGLNNGTITGATWTGSGYFGYTGDDSLTFDGAGDYVTVSHNANINFERTDAFSISMWVKFNEIGSATNEALISKRQTTGDQKGYVVWKDTTDNINFQLEGDNSPVNRLRVSASPGLQNGVWYFITTTYDGTSLPSGVKIYVNGVNQTLTTVTNSLSLTIANTEPLLIGTQTLSALDFNGFIDNVVIYNEELTSEEIVSQYQASLDTGSAFSIDTSAPFVEEEMVVFKNNGTTQSYISGTGEFVGPGVVSTGQVLLQSTSNVVPLTITAYSSQAANLTEWKSFSGTTIAYIDANGNLVAQDITANEVITPQLTSNSATQAEPPATTTSGLVSYWKMDDNKIDGVNTSDANLQNYWKLDEGDGTIAIDTQGNQNATLNNALAWNGSGYFAGTDSWHGNGSSYYIDSGSRLTGNTAFSLKLWFYLDQLPSSLGTDMTLFGTTDANNSALFIAVDDADNRLKIFHRNGGTNPGQLTASSVLSAGQWYSVVVTAVNNGANNNWTVYLNGETTNGLSTTAYGQGQTIQRVANFYIGALNNAASATVERYFDGLISNVALYNDVITADEALRMYRKEISTYIADYVGINHGSFAGDATFLTTPNGAFGYDTDNATTYDGTGDWAHIADANSLDLTGDYTAYIWFNTSTNFASNHFLFSKYNDGINDGWGIRIGADEKITGIHRSGSSTNSIVSTNTYADGVWHMAALTFEAGVGSKLYIDGELVASGATTTTALTNTSLGVRIGAQDYTTPRPFTGKLDNAVLYSVTRTPEQIAQDYANGVGGGVGTIINTTETFASQDSKLISVRTANTEKLYIGLNVIGFTPDADKTIYVERATASSTAGYDLTLSAGGATESGTDLAGGDVYIKAGTATGSGGSNIYLQTAGGGSSGTADVTPVTRLTIASDGSIQVATGGELRFYNSTYYVGLKAPTSLSANTVWELPSADGSNGQVLATDGSSALSWTWRNSMTRTQVSSSTHNATSTDEYIGVTYTSSGAVSVYLPTPTEGRVVIIKDEAGNAGTNGITISPNASEQINGGGSVSISTNYGAVRVVSDGTNWFTF